MQPPRSAVARAVISCEGDSLTPPTAAVQPYMQEIVPIAATLRRDALATQPRDTRMIGAASAEGEGNEPHPTC